VLRRITILRDNKGSPRYKASTTCKYRAKSVRQDRESVLNFSMKCVKVVTTETISSKLAAWKISGGAAYEGSYSKIRMHDSEVCARSLESKLWRFYALGATNLSEKVRITAATGFSNAKIPIPRPLRSAFVSNLLSFTFPLSY
jgi:hypothetical protein